jgi:hypothetical protein
MDDFLAHAIVNPTARPEQVAAKALGVELGEKIRERPPVNTWRAKTADGKEVALVTLDPAAPGPVRDRFAATATRLRELEVPGVLKVRDVSPRRDAYVTDLWSTGTARDLPTLRWPLRRRLELVRRVGQALEGLHKGGLIHGALTQDAVLLDDDLEPVVSDVGLPAPAVPPSGGAPTAPEPDVAGDIWALGKLLEDVAGADTVPDLVELVRRCTAAIPAGRPSSVGQVLNALQAIAEELPTSEVMPVAAPKPAPEAAREIPIRKPTPAMAFDPKARPADPMRQSRPNFAATQEPAGPSPALVRGVGIVGASAFVVSLVLGFFFGGGGALGGPLAVVGVLGAAAATLLAPPFPRSRRLVRIALAAGLGAVVVVADPLSFVCRLGALSRMHGSSDARRAAVAEIVRLDRDFRGAGLSGVDLSGLDLTAADLRGADLSHTDLSHARLWAAQLEGSSLEGAKLSGADLQQSTLSQAINVGTAICDNETRLPAGWKCQDGSPVP